MKERGLHDDAFSMVTRGLEGLFTDPLVTWVRETASTSDALINELQEEERTRLVQHTMAELNTRWPYIGKTVCVTGRVNLPKGEDWSSHIVVDQQFVSRGFRSIETIETDDFGEARRKVIRTFYEFEMNEGSDDDRRKLLVLALPEMIEAIDLPYPSAELRARRFAYDNPEDAQYLDMQVAVDDADQALFGLANYYLEIDATPQMEDVEKVKDATAYLRTQANLEPQANYYLRFDKEVIVIDDEGARRPCELKQEYAGIGSIQDVVLYPGKSSEHDKSASKRALMPHIDVILFHPTDRSKDQRLLIPCHSLLTVLSARRLLAN